MSQIIPAAVNHYVEEYLNYLFDKTPKPVCNAIILKHYYDMLPLEVQIKMHIEGVLILPYFINKDGTKTFQ